MMRVGFVLVIVFLLIPTLSFAATDVYYSVGTNASDLKNGSTTITISSGVATFNVSQLDKIGVGDKITYVGNVSYISGRINSSAYNVVTAKGAVPLDVSDMIVYNITRAFNSLDDAVDAADGGVCANDSNHLNITNLTEGNYTPNIACYGDGADTDAVVVDGWTTGADNYIKIYTPVSSSEVGTTQRHNGKWNSDRYRLEVSVDADAIKVLDSYVMCEGIQIESPNYASRYGIVIQDNGNNNLNVSHCIVKASNSSQTDCEGINFRGTSSRPNYAYNNIIYGYAGGTWGQCIGVGDQSGSDNNYIYSNTVVNCNYGIRSSTGGQIISKNNIAFNCTDAYAGSFHADSTNNAYSEGTDPGFNGLDISNNLSSDLFVDYENDDFHLKADSILIDNGTNLLSNLTDDIDGETRTGTWDIGADEYNASYQYTVVTLVSPINNHGTTESSITFNCSASDNSNLENITLWGDWSGWHANETVNISGTSNSTPFTKTLSEGIYTWNCIAYDNDSNSDWGNSNNTLTVDSTPPNVTVISDLPDPQGLGENVTITVNVTDNVGIDTVLVGITPPGGSETNYTMTNQSSIYSYNYLNYTNGTYIYTIYANDGGGNLNNSETGTFNLYSDIYLHVKTLKDTYGANEIVNITDPFEFDLSGLIVDESNVVEENNDNLAVVEEKEIGGVLSTSKIFSSISGFFESLFDRVLGINEMVVSDVSGESVNVPDVDASEAITNKTNDASDGTIDAGDVSVQDTGVQWEGDYFYWDAETHPCDGSELPNPPFWTMEVLHRGHTTCGNTPQGNIYFEWLASTDTILASNAGSGATSITIADITGWHTGADISVTIQLNDGSWHWTTQSSASGSTVYLNDALPGAANSGNAISQGWGAHYTEIHNTQNLPITCNLGDTYYLAYYMNFERINGFDIWHEGSEVQSGDKGIEITGDGIRWVTSRGQWSSYVTNDDHHYTVFLGNPNYHLNPELEHCDVYFQNQNGYSNINPIQLEYERWYSVVMAIKMASDHTGSVTAYINGEKVFEYNNIQTSSVDTPTITDIKMGGTIAQPLYDAPPHYRKFDALILTDSWQDIVDGGYLSDPEANNPPTRTNPSPTGTLTAGTTSANISLTTNVNATCRYSNTSNTNYTDMEFNFTNTNSTNHSTLVADLENNHTYIYYIRCNSTDGYYNENDWNITFSVGDGHKADTNNDSIIDMPELMAFIARWKADSNDVNKSEVEEARNIWFGGGY
ncbi:MAG: hypothetical protein DRP06_01315 [Candidatus Aenigmatarchaeota archaeon]|nr:MAG: hypothetical protein DRP06_01315 [Candidatus Aenigmarchaeota archaeon]